MALSRQQALAAVALAVVVAAAVLASEASAAITCGQVGTALSPCIPYATGRGGLTSGCCTGVRTLNSEAKTSADRQSACRCLKSLAGSLKRLNMGTVAAIPGKCGVSVPFPISMSTDCNNGELDPWPTYYYVRWRSQQA
ncbi:hypothetical protein ACP4OV_014442 [Aristida adscensionis]